MANENDTKTCSGDCMRCSVQQRAYCSAQMSRNALDILERMERRQAEMMERIEAIEHSGDGDDSVFNPMDGAPAGRAS